MTTTTAAPAVKVRQRPGDRWFSGTALFAGSMILVTLAAVAIFLIIQSIPGLTATSDTASLLTSNFWAVRRPAGVRHGLGVAPRPAHGGAAVCGGRALHLALRAPPPGADSRLHRRPARGRPVGRLRPVGHHGPRSRRAAVYAWLNANMGWFPLFSGTVSSTGRTIFTAAIVLAVMVVPIITAICREIFLQTPVLHEEAALALGATRWEMVQMAVFPFGRSGIVSASMLGLGRALGETMAVAMVLSVANVVTFQLFTAENPGTIPANIALTFPEAYGTNINVLIATGLILFIVTFAVNALARWIVSRRKEFSGAN